MPYDDPDPTDPMTLHGVECPTEDDEAVREMAECFIEEFARMGFDEDRLMRMFTVNGYAGPNLALRTLGENVIRSMISEQLGVRRQAPSRVEVNTRACGSIGLPVLDQEY
jgi:hypothetical protein